MKITLATIILVAATTTAFAQPASSSDRFDCSQWTQVGPITWNEKGTAVFDFGRMKDVHLDKTPVQKGAFTAEGHDLFEAITKACGSK